jgi:hypothetical protein
MECRYCNKLCKNENSLRNHERLCKSNPGRQNIVSNFISYNKKRKELSIPGTNQYIKAKENGITITMSDDTKRKISNKLKGRLLSESHKQRLKESMKLAVINNPESYSANNVSGRTPIIEYNGFYLKGSWELLVAKYLDKLGIKWTNILDGISYMWNDNKHLYFPDFYLTEYDVYVEVKGYERERDKCKWNGLDNLIVIKKKEIELIKNNKYVFQLK